MDKKCVECKWMDTFEEFCLLGRESKKCNSFKARRGDDDFATRLIDAHTDGVVDEDKLKEREPGHKTPNKPKLKKVEDKD